MRARLVLEIMGDDGETIGTAEDDDHAFGSSSPVNEEVKRPTTIVCSSALNLQMQVGAAAAGPTRPG